MSDARPATSRDGTHGDAPRGGDRIAHTEATVIGTSPIERTAIEEALGPRSELMTINMGPHHPATHGVLRLLVSLEGEIVRDLKPIIGYVHTGIEKNCEDKTYWKVIPFVERMDYISYYFQMQAFCGAVERLLELEIPARAQYLRVIHLELNRIHSHLVWLGHLGARPRRDVDVLLLLPRARPDPRPVRDVHRASGCTPATSRSAASSRTSRSASREKVRAFCDEMPSRIDQYEAILTRNEIFLQRTKGIGIVRRERLLELGVTGPLLRAAGEPWDLRKADPYLSYADLDFQIPVGTVGDGWDRYRVRIQEMRESVRIIEQALDGLPEGPWIADDRKVVLPPRHELSTSMESLIHHFKLVTEGFRVPPGEVYYAIESPRGELGCFVLADGSAKPARVHFRDPSFVNLQALRDMCIDGYVADLIQNLAMLDPILGGIDR